MGLLASKSDVVFRNNTLVLSGGDFSFYKRQRKRSCNRIEL